MSSAEEVVGVRAAPARISGAYEAPSGTRTLTVLAVASNEPSSQARWPQLLMAPGAGGGGSMPQLPRSWNARVVLVTAPVGSSMIVLWASAEALACTNHSLPPARNDQTYRTCSGFIPVTGLGRFDTLNVATSSG